jgi:hypothetical protein
MGFKATYLREAQEGQSYQDWLWMELNTQLDILSEGTRRLHHVLGPLSLSLRLAEELERVGDN